MADASHPEDISALGVHWIYVWGECDYNAPVPCITMTRDMSLPRACPPYLLVGNEPNAIEPWGAPVTPEDAVNRVLAIEAQCPNSRLVVGNVSADDWSTAGGWGTGEAWIRVFQAGYYWAMGRNFSGILAGHCYTQNLADYCIGKLAQFRKLYRGEMWITEWNVLSGDTKQFRRLLTYINRNFTRSAIYTNRQPNATWALLGADLINADGSLTPNGQIYANTP